SWAGLRVEIELERAHWFTRLWLGERDLGGHDSLSTPHRYEILDAKPGRHLLTVLVDNDARRIDVGENSHSVSDHTQGNWNGVVGSIVLRATPQTWIDRVDVFPNVAARLVRVTGFVAGFDKPSAERRRVTLRSTRVPAEGGKAVELPAVEAEV